MEVPLDYNPGIQVADDVLSGAKVIQQRLTERVETATAILPLEPPDSGDFHEAMLIPDGSGDVGVLLGDVTGHGTSAAIKADKIRRTAIASLRHGDSPLQTIDAANQVTHTDGDDRFATLFVARINSETGDFTYANAGHESPVIAEGAGRTSTLVSTGPPLGVLPSTSEFFTEEKAKLPDGGTMLVTTDGVLEARQRDGAKPQFFGYERLVSIFQSICHFSPLRIVKALLKQVIEFSRSNLHDDVVIMAIRRHEDQSGKSPGDVST